MNAWRDRAANAMAELMGLVDMRVVAFAFVIAIIAPPVGAWLASRRRESAASWLAAILAGALIALLTVLNRGVYTGQGDLITGLGWWSRGWSEALDPAHFDVSDVLNVLLFMPAGWAWSQLARSTRRAVGALVLVSLSIETMQALILVGRPDVADLLTNSAGAAIGAAVWVVHRGALRLLLPRTT